MSILRIPGVSIKSIINLHFDSLSTKISDDETIDNQSHTTPKNKPKDIKVNIRDAYDKISISHDSDKIGKKAMIFLDSKKNKIKLWPLMIDITNNGILPLYTDKPCRTCHHTYTTHPIGCPISYIENNPSDLVLKQQIINFMKENNLPFDQTDFFETEKMFCTFSCVKLYILEKLSLQPQSYRYLNSLSYLTSMCQNLLGTDSIPIITPSQPLDMLKVYGGHLTIEEYRESVNFFVYDTTINIKRPIMFSCSPYFEEISINKKI